MGWIHHRMSRRKYFYSSKIRLIVRGGSRAAATSKMECFLIIVNGFKPLTIIKKHSILDVAAALDPPLIVSRGGAKSAGLNALSFYF